MATGHADAVHQRVLENVGAIEQDQNVLINVRIFEEAEILLPKTVQGEQRLPLIQRLAALLPQLHQDPTPVVNLLLKLIQDFAYTDILAFGTDSLPYVRGLAVGEQMVSVNRLILTILEKATLKASDAAHVASMLDTMLAVVRLWLLTNDPGIANQASRLLLDLLKIDQEIQVDPDAHLPAGGQGLVWKRIFGDRDIYGSFFDACSLQGPLAVQMGKKQTTLAQARLMEWLPAVGKMDWNAISRSHHSDIEQTYGVEGGLLSFAALHMVDYKDDVLMYRCLIDFYADLLYSVKPLVSNFAGARDSPALLYLIAEGLHVRTAAMYLQLPAMQLDSVETMFLYGPAANYIATYASSYPEHFMASQMLTQINDRLLNVLDLSPGRWAHADSPKHDLHVLASLPRVALLPGGDGTGQWRSSPLSRLPSKSTNTDVLLTLATIFHGPDEKIVTFPPSSPIDTAGNSEQASVSAARALYYHYVANNPRFWNDIVTHSDTVALKELALAALNCLYAIINANWNTEPEFILPSTIATPEQSYIAVLSPPALEYILPYLLKPPQTFANLVGGRGDAESAAYKIAIAKFDALHALHGKLVAQVAREPNQGYEEIVATITKRLSDGPMSREGEVGGRIGTLEL